MLINFMRKLLFILFYANLLIKTSLTKSLMIELSHSNVYAHAGYVITHFVFENGNPMIKYKLNTTIANSPQLLVFPAHIPISRILTSVSACNDFFNLSIAQISLKYHENEETVNLGFFSDFYPVVILFKDKLSCTDSKNNFFYAKLELQLINSENNHSSASTVGIASVLIYFSLANFLFGIILMFKVLYIERKQGKIMENVSCKIIFKSFNCDIHLLFVLFIFIFQSCSFFMAYIDYIHCSSDSFYLLSAAASNADGISSYAAEICSLISQYVLLVLLLCADSGNNLSTRPMHFQRASKDTYCFTVNNCEHQEIFNHGFLYNRPRIKFIKLLLTLQLIFYVTIVLHDHNDVAFETAWPLEERNGYWGGLGIPDLIKIDNEFVKMPLLFNSTKVYNHSTVRTPSIFDLNYLTVLLGFILLVARIALGFLFGMHQLQQAKRTRCITLRDVQSDLGIAGLIWYGSIPISYLLSGIVTESLQYKMTVVSLSSCQTIAAAVLLKAFIFPQSH